MPRLILGDPRQSAKSFPLQGDKISLGRDSSNHIVLDDPAVSRMHAEIVPINGNYHVRDLGSTNGVFVNEQRVKEAELRHKDRLRLGSTVLVFLEKEEPWPNATVETPPCLSEISIPFFAVRDMESLEKDFQVQDIPDLTDSAAQKKQEGLMQAFYRLSQVLAQDKNFKDVLKEALVDVLRIVGGDSAMVFLSTQPGTCALEPFLAVRGDQPVAFDKLQYSRTLLCRALESGQAILISNTRADAGLSETPSVFASNIHSAMCVPLRTARESFGVMQVDARSPGDRFTRMHLEILSVMAKELAIYLENIKLRKDLKAATEKLQDVERMRAKFISTLGYQIATPITIIDQCCNLFREGLLGNVDPQQKDAMEVLARHSERLKFIVRDLERITAWEMLAKKVYHIQEVFDIQECVETVLGDLRTLFGAKKQEFCWTRGPSPIQFRGNKQAIGEVIVHILVNAYKFTPNGTRIELSIREENEDVLIQIEDNGLGIPPEILREIFESFFVGDEKLAFTQSAPRHLSRSLGLGLFMCKRIVEGHGGKIWAESEVGKFTRFSIRLPKRAQGVGV